VDTSELKATQVSESVVADVFIQKGDRVRGITKRLSRLGKDKPPAFR
jgi:hypothetical protein